jgi:hypothetical protein
MFNKNVIQEQASVINGWLKAGQALFYVYNRIASFITHGSLRKHPFYRVNPYSVCYLVSENVEVPFE